MKSNTTLRLGAIAATLVGLLAVAPAADAQGRNPGQRPARAERADSLRRRPVDPALRIERRVAMLTQRLQLTESQQAQIRTILGEEQRQMQALFDHAGMRRPEGARPQGERRRGERPAAPSDSARAAMRERMEAHRAQMDSIRTRTEQRIEGVLTAQQRTTYRELRESMRNRGGERPMRGANARGRHGPPGGVGRRPAGSGR